jgi:hypothetical protein
MFLDAVVEVEAGHLLAADCLAFRERIVKVHLLDNQRECFVCFAAGRTIASAGATGSR